MKLLEKWFPLQGEWGHSSYYRCFQKQNREMGEIEYKQQAYQFTQCYNILHRLQVHHPILTNKYIIREYGSTLYVGLARAVSPTNTNFRLTFFTNPTSGGSL